MKKLIALWCLLLSSAFAADSFHFTETLTDKAGMDGVTSKDRVSLAASLDIPGLGQANLNDSTRIHLALGGLNFDEVVSNAFSHVANTVTFHDADHPSNNGRLTFIRAGDRLIISGNTDNLTGDNGTTMIVTDLLSSAPTNETVRGSVPFSVQIDDLQPKTGLVFYRATKRVVHAGQNLLRTYTVTGDLDTTRPTVTITSPHANERILTDTITISGRTTDNVGVGGVNVFVNGESAGSADVAANGTWSKTITLSPGQNTIEVEASDLASNESSRTTVKVNRVTSAPLNLTVDAGGTVRGGTNSQAFEVGRPVTLVAMANPGYLFVGWEGSVSNHLTSPVQPLKMVNGGLNIHAIFRPRDFTGIFLPDAAENVSATNSGYFALSRTASGVLSGKIILEGRTYVFSGKHLTETNTASFNVTRAGKTNLQVQLAINDKIVTGTVSDGTFTSTLEARANASVANSFAGRYTAVIRANTHSPDTIPSGAGPLVINVTRSSAIVTGTLPDGTTISFSSPLLIDPSTDTQVYLPVYASLLGGREVVVGWLILAHNQQGETGGVTIITLPPTGIPPGSFSNQNGATSDTITNDPRLYWIKAPSQKDKLYKAGFTAQVSVFGGRYKAPTGTNTALGFTAADVLFIDGDLAPFGVSHEEFVEKPGTVSKTKVTLTDDPQNTGFPTAASLKSHININPNTGAVTGDFKHPVSGAVTQIRGNVVQRGNLSVIEGYFLGARQSGEFVVNPMITNGAP